MRYLIADLVTEFLPKYDLLADFANKFTYNGDRPTDISLNVPQKSIENLLQRMKKGTLPQEAESFAVGNAFFKQSVKYGTMLLHSSAIVFDGKAYLFSAQSGIGKSTHTRLWQQAFGEKVSVINDDKPAVRVLNSKAVAYGTPFDGGSGIAENISAPLKAIVFLERGEQNSVRRATTEEILKNLYFSTVHMLDRATAEKMLGNFESLIAATDFYILTCNTDISAAYTAYNGIVGNQI